MNRLFALCLAAVIVLGGTVYAYQDSKPKPDAAKPAADAPAKVDDGLTFTERASYALGANVGTYLQTLKGEEIELDFDMVIRGMKDSLEASAKPLVDESTCREAINELNKKRRDFRTKQQEKEAEDRAKQGDANKQIGADFLAENAKKEGVVSLPSGLQYKILAAGEGASPAVTDKVKVHYRGTLIDGTEFDSSYKRGQPASFGLNRVIKGWTEGLQLMKPGSKYNFYIPSDLAYGDRGTGSIPAHSVLIFEVELLEIL